MRPIVHIPSSVLNTPARRVTSFDKKLHMIIEDMKETLRSAKNPKGVGLAAPQVGIPLQIFLTRPSEKDDIRVFINPDITHRGKPIQKEKQTEHLEGCLSIPSIWGNVERPPTLTISYQDEKGTQHKETISGFLATIICHETDHVNGILFTQRVLEQKNKLYQSTKDEKGKEILEEISI